MSKTIVERLKAMHMTGIDIELTMSISDEGGTFYDGQVSLMVGYYDEGDDIPVTYAGKSMQFSHHDSIELVLDEMEAFIKTLNMKG